MREGSGSDCLVFSEEVVVDVISDLVNLQELPFHIYPNPAFSEIIIDPIEATTSKLNYFVFNQLGACVAHGKDIPTGTSLQN